MLLIPAIDLIDGKCVRLSRGDYAKKTEYAADPVGVARSFAEQGARWLHVVDLDAAKGEGKHNRKVIARIVGAACAAVEVGGGARDRAGVRELLDMGVDRVVLGTIIVKNGELARDLVLEFGERLAAGIDAREGVVHVSGWTEGGGVEAVELGRRVKRMGFSLIVYTDIARDGMLTGPNIEATREMALGVALPIIASGGVARIEDIRALKPLEEVGVVGVISGKALYEGRLSVREACKLLQGE